MSFIQVMLSRYEQKAARLYKQQVGVADKKRTRADRKRGLVLVWACALLSVTNVYSRDATDVTVTSARYDCETTTPGNVVNLCGHDKSYDSLAPGSSVKTIQSSYFTSCATAEGAVFDNGLSKNAYEGLLLQASTNTPSSKLSVLESQNAFVDGGISVDQVTSNNGHTSTPVACLRQATSTHDNPVPSARYIMSLFPPSLSKTESIMSPELIPTKPIEAVCSGEDTYSTCYERGRLAYNLATCKNSNGGAGPPGSCGITTMTAAESLSSTLVVAKGFTQPDLDASLVANSGADLIAPALSFPAGLPTATATVSNPVEVFDFIIKDGGDASATPPEPDNLTTNISVLKMATSGTGDFSKLTWLLNGAGANDIAGVYEEATNTLTFGDSNNPLTIAVPDGQPERYAVKAFFNTTAGVTNGDTYLLTVNGATDATMKLPSTLMGITQNVSNGSGAKAVAAATDTGGGGSLSLLEWLLGLSLLSLSALRRLKEAHYETCHYSISG